LERKPWRAYFSRCRRRSWSLVVLGVFRDSLCFPLPFSLHASLATSPHRQTTRLGLFHHSPECNCPGEFFSIRFCTRLPLSFPCLFHSRPLDARGWQWAACQCLSARTNLGLGVAGRVDSPPSAGIRAVVELTAAGISPSCRIFSYRPHRFSNPSLPTHCS
jgi:hypothetical protein